MLGLLAVLLVKLALPLSVVMLALLVLSVLVLLVLLFSLLLSLFVTVTVWSLFGHCLVTVWSLFVTVWSVLSSRATVWVAL